MDQIKIAVIGGSGFYDIPGMNVIARKNIETPFGNPSDEITVIDVNGVPTAFLPRHGRGHKINPSNVNSRANIFALKTLGVESIISVSAVGSLRENIHPREFVIPDQIIDRTKCRVNSFYDPYAVHVGFADPFCSHLSEMLLTCGAGVDVNIHKGGTYVCMEGPLFSTKAESAMHRSWGASIIGMTALPEAKLAREAEICYVAIALVTDYDVWKEDEIVELETVLANIKANTSNVRKLVIDAIPKIFASDANCSCRTALQTAFFTDPALIPIETKRAWQPLIGKYFKADE